MYSGALERLAPAMVSSDLTVTTSLDNAHFVAALGYASRQYPIASPLVRMYLTGDKTAVHAARACAAQLARTAARRRNITFKAAEVAQVARHALEYAVDKTCPRCHGTKYETTAGTNRLSTTPCAACHGDGRKILPRKNRAVIIEVVARIERIESNLDVLVAHRV